jgi:formylmethanofuran dehydrogenase subunit B
MMKGVPCVVVGPNASESALAEGEAVVDTGMAGIHEGGTAIRMDDIPLPLRPTVSGPPAAAAVVRALGDLIRRSLPTQRGHEKDLPGQPSLLGLKRPDTVR